MVAPLSGAQPSDPADQVRPPAAPPTPQVPTPQEHGIEAGAQALGDAVLRGAGRRGSSGPIDLGLGENDPKDVLREAKAKDALFRSYQTGVSDWDPGQAGNQANWSGNYIGAMQALQRHLGIPETGEFDVLTYAKIMLTGDDEQKKAAQALGMQQKWWNPDLAGGGVSPSLVVELHEHRNDPPVHLPDLVPRIVDPPPSGFDPTRILQGPPRIL